MSSKFELGSLTNYTRQHKLDIVQAPFFIVLLFVVLGWFLDVSFVLPTAPIVSTIPSAAVNLQQQQPTLTSLYSLSNGNGTTTTPSSGGTNEISTLGLALPASKSHGNMTSVITI